MHAAIGWQSGVIRVSRREDFADGDPDWCDVLYLTTALDGAAELHGLRSDRWSMAHRSAVGRALWRAGFRRVRWRRVMPDGRSRIAEFGLARFAEITPIYRDGTNLEIEQ